MKLYCFPHAGGSASIFTPFQNYFIEQGIDPAPLEYPGHGSRMSEALCRSISELATDVVERVIASGEEFCLYGHSLGGHVAFEVARVLQQKNNTSVKHLFLSGCASPSVPLKFSGLHKLPLDQLFKKLSDLGGILNPDNWVAETHQIFLPILQADFEVVSSIVYQKNKPLNVPITGFVGTDDIYSLSEVQQWQYESKYPLSAYQFKGNHFFPFDHMKEIVGIISNKLHDPSLSLTEA